MYYLNKMKNHILNWSEYAKEHFLRIITILLIILIFCYFFTLLPKENVINGNCVVEQHILIFGTTLENWFTYISLVALLFTAIWAIYQFDKSTSRKQQEKGAEISKIVASNLMYKCSILGNVIIKSKLNELFDFDSLIPFAFKNFDKSELLSLFNNDDSIFLTLKAIYNSNEIQQIYFRILEVNISQNQYKNLEEKTYSDKEAQELFILDNSNMPFHFTELLCSVLNELEYISMYISSQSAHSKYIYQSLHQFFIKTIKLLAPLICIQNKDYSDKYYTNIIYVYNEWCLLRDIDLKKEKKKKEKVSKILNPKIKTV